MKHYSSASKTAGEDSPRRPTHRFAGSLTVNRLSSNAKTRYLRRTATGKRRQLSLEPSSQEGSETEGRGDDSDDLYAPPNPVSARTRRRGQKRTGEAVDTPIYGSVKRLKVGASARGAFLRQVAETGFSPLMAAKTPKMAPARLRSISVLEKSIDRATIKRKSAERKFDDESRRVKSLAFCLPEEADAVGALRYESPDIA